MSDTGRNRQLNFAGVRLVTRPRSFEHLGRQGSLGRIVRGRADAPTRWRNHFELPSTQPGSRRGTIEDQPGRSTWDHQAPAAGWAEARSIDLLAVVRAVVASSYRGGQNEKSPRPLFRVADVTLVLMRSMTGERSSMRSGISADRSARVFMIAHHFRSSGDLSI